MGWHAGCSRPDAKSRKNFFKKNAFYPLTDRLLCAILYLMKDKKESIFTVTFTDGGEVFIQAMDEGHARRIIENNGQWRRNTEEKPFDRCIQKIEKN